MTLDEDHEDLCDYLMSDTAICEAPRVALAPGLPYHIGFRSKTLSRAGPPTLKQILALDDEQFRRFIQNGCQFHGEKRTSESAAALRDSDVSALRARVKTLEDLVHHTLRAQLSTLVTMAPTGSAKNVQGVGGPVRGLDIEPR